MSKVNLQLPSLTAWKHLSGHGAGGRTQAQHNSLTELRRQRVEVKGAEAARICATESRRMGGAQNKSSRNLHRDPFESLA